MGRRSVPERSALVGGVGPWLAGGMRVLQLWRYPVKSMQGERLDRATFTPTGIEGDRRWGIVDRGTGRILTAKRVPELLYATARWVEERPVVTLPGDHTSVAGWLGRDAALVEARADERGTYEIAQDPFDEASALLTWNGPKGTFHDSNRTQVHLLSVGSAGAWDLRRFRPNLVVDGDGEFDLVGSTLRVGTAVLSVVKRTDRCVMTTRPQPGGIERDPEVLKAILLAGGDLGVGCTVVQPGDVHEGDEVEVA
jgi:uncharacterized protein